VEGTLVHPGFPHQLLHLDAVLFRELFKIQIEQEVTIPQKSSASR
jgi:hypothetical protein